MVARARFLAPVALAALSMVAALSMGRLLDSARFVGPVVGAALLPHALGALYRRLRVPIVAAVGMSALALALYVTLALERSTATFGFPNGDTWAAFERQLNGGWHLLRTQTAPAHTTDGAILLAVLATWCIAAFADFLAFRPGTTRATLAAIAPALVLFVWTSTLGTTDDRTLATAAFCVATGAFLLFQHVALLDRRRSWLVSREAAPGRVLVPAAALGVVALTIGLLVAPQLPGAGADPLLDFVSTARTGSGGRSYRTDVAPFVDIGAKLQHDADVELFTVASKTPDYWRIAALDEYTSDGGGQWTLRADGSGSVSVGLPKYRPVQHRRHRRGAAGLSHHRPRRTLASGCVPGSEHQPLRHAGGRRVDHARHPSRRPCAACTTRWSRGFRRSRPTR